MAFELCYEYKEEIKNKIDEENFKIDGNKGGNECERYKPLGINKKRVHFPRTKYICKKCKIFLCEYCFEEHKKKLKNDI